MSFFNQQPNSSGQTTGGLFGTTNNNTGGSLFGAAASKPSGTTFSFGQPSSTSASTAPSTTGTSLFGQGSGNIFGKPADKKDEAPNSFLNPSNAQTPQNLFTPQNKNKIESTTPAGQPPTTSIFGASTGTNAQASKGIFNLGQTPSTAAASTGTTQSTGMFGQPSSQPASTGLFGGATGSTSNLFGAKPSTPAATQSSATPSLFGAAQPSTSSTTNLFGQAATTSAAQPASTPVFSGFGQQKKDDKPAETPKSLFPSLGNGSAPASSQPTSNLFGQVGAGSGTPSLLNPKGGGAPPAEKTQASTAAPAGGFFAKPTLPASQSTETPKLAPFSLGGTSKPASTESPAAFAGVKLGGPTTTAPSTTTAAPSSAPAATTNLFGSTGTTTAPSTTPAIAATLNAPTNANVLGLSQQLTASTSGPQASNQSRLRNKTMDEILTRWASDLTRYTKEFKQHSEQIARWDQIIVDNSSKIDKLYVKTRTCEKQTMSVEMQLSAVENQQNELESWLDKYEKDVDDMIAKDGTSSSELGGPDQDRERTYKLAEKLGDRLDDMDSDLKSMIEEVNSANADLSGGSKGNEPVSFQTLILTMLIRTRSHKLSRFSMLISVSYKQSIKEQRHSKQKLLLHKSKHKE